MEILKPYQIKAWEVHTMLHQSCTEANLMLRAAEALFHWISNSSFNSSTFYVFCGKGNNGGDGLALAKLLDQAGIKTVVYILEFGQSGSTLFQEHLQKLRETSVEIHFYSESHPIYLPKTNTVIIDALFGIGLNQPVSGIAATLVLQLNASNVPILSIDIPSGMFADQSSLNTPVIHATKTLTFQCYKPAFLYRENATNLGEIIVLPIDLVTENNIIQNNDIQFISKYQLNKIYKRRSLFSHKGDFGHALLIVGRAGMMGAAQLAAKACLRSGVGKLTTLVPESGLYIMQTQVPEAICISHEQLYLEKTVLPKGHFQAYGIGSGIGLTDTMYRCLSTLLKQKRVPLLLDADALNILGNHKNLIEELPEGTILTPHPKEFDRLFGESTDEFAQTQLQLEMSKQLNIIIVLKGHFTKIASPDGQLWVNNTGNSGLSKAGTGDVLTGMITAFLAQGYAPLEAAMLGVYLHGLAADICLNVQSKESMLASDIIEAFGEAFTTL